VNRFEFIWIGISKLLKEAYPMVKILTQSIIYGLPLLMLGPIKFWAQESLKSLLGPNSIGPPDYNHGLSVFWIFVRVWTLVKVFFFFFGAMDNLMNIYMLFSI
jgi:hypothetical protein